MPPIVEMIVLWPRIKGFIALRTSQKKTLKPNTNMKTSTILRSFTLGSTVKTLILLSSLAVAIPAQAGTVYTWNNTAGGDWNTTANWTPTSGTWANTDTADLSTLDITSETTITGPSGTTRLGHMIIGYTNGDRAYTILANGSGSLLFNNTGGTGNATLILQTDSGTATSPLATINAPVTVGTDLDITNTSAGRLRLLGSINLNNKTLTIAAGAGNNGGGGTLFGSMNNGGTPTAGTVALSSGYLGLTSALYHETVAFSVNGGTLDLRNATGPAGTIAVNTGGTLTSSQATTTGGGALTLVGGTIDANGSSVGSLGLASAKDFTMTLGTVNLHLGTSFDQILSTGGGAKFDISGGTLALTLGAGFDYNNTYAVFSGFDGTNAVSGLGFTGYDSVNYDAVLGTNGVLSFTVIPEPSTFVMLLGGLGTLMLLRRRRA